MSTETFIGSAKAAEMLNVSLRTVQLWVEKGVLRAWKTPGGHRRIALKDIEAQLRQRSIQVGQQGDQLKVLIVEDTPAQRKLYQKYFEVWKLPVELCMASDGFQGLIKIGERIPDLLITDLMMPGMDGVQMIDSIKNSPNFQQLEILVVTAMDRDSREVRKLQDMGLQIIFKPIPFDEIKVLIEKRIAGQKGAPLDFRQEVF
ncbi:MAG: response regulator [Pseudomonadota bacterium]